jgi:phospholipase/carboxylesterase
MPQAQEFESKALPFVLLQPDSAPEAASGWPLVIFLHGFGANMYDLVSLSTAIDSDHYAYAFPNAPYVVRFASGQFGYSWSAERDGVIPPRPGAPSLEELLGAFLEEVTQQTETPPGQIVLAGFSQGGGLALRYGLPRPDVFAGLACLSGAFRNADQETLLSRLPEQRTQPILVAHGARDPQVRIDVGRATKAFLESVGYTPLYREYEMGHEITPEELRDFTPWLHEVLPTPGAIAASWLRDLSGCVEHQREAAQHDYDAHNHREDRHGPTDQRAADNHVSCPDHRD